MKHLYFIIVAFLMLTPIAFAQIISDSPYAIFGDNSHYLEAKNDTVQDRFRVYVVSESNDFFFVDFDFCKGTAILTDNYGNVFLVDSISDNAKAMFTSVDPKSEKYYGISPYSYCAGDPVNFIDPTGQIIMICDSQGNLVPYMESSDDVFVNKVTDMLNNMKDNGGSNMVNCLQNSDNVYVYTKEAAKDGGEKQIAGFQPTENGGIIRLGDEFLTNTPAAQDYVFSHESFHGYQQECGQNALTITSEIGAIVFGVKYSQINSPIGYYPMTVHGTSEYQNAVTTLIDGNFDLRSFSKAVNLFTTSASGANIYKNIPLGNITSGASFLHKSFVFKK